MAKLRVAFVQIEFQPALALNHVAYLEEPVMPPPKQPQSQSLSGLAARGVNVIALAQYCREQYVQWAKSRLEAILKHLGTLTPAPDLVLLPEGAIPLEVLPLVHRWASEHGSTVLAGTHSPQVHVAGRQAYLEAGVTRHDVSETAKANAESLLPVLQKDKTRLLQKSNPSVFELSDVAQPVQRSRKRKSITVQTSDGSSVDVTPFICSEALLDDGKENKADVLAVISLEETSARFAPWMQHQVANRRVVLYCNTAQYGGSRVGVSADHRHPNWFLETFVNGLPPGEAILVVDVDTSVVSVETATARPGNVVELVELAGIVSNGTVEETLSREFATACESDDVDERARLVSDVVVKAPQGSLLALRATRIQFDALRGHPALDAVRALRRDCLTGCRSLKDLQRDLAGACADGLIKLIPSTAARGGDASQVLMALLQTFTRVRSQAPVSVPEQKAEARGLLDREDERTRLKEFVDTKSSVVLAVTGLPGAGKSALIKQGLEHLGISAKHRVVLDDATSAEFLYRSIAGELVGVVPISRAEAQDRLTRSLNAGQVVVLDGSNLFLDYDHWTEPEVEEFLGLLIAAAAEKGAKIIIECCRRPPGILEGVSGSERLFIPGLDGRRSKYGMQLLEGQLRRMGLPVDFLSVGQKERIVSLLSGNPKALELAAVACLDEGVDGVLSSLEQGSGSVAAQIQRLLRITRFSDAESLILALLSRAKTEVPREVIGYALRSDAGATVASLVVAGAVEIHDAGAVAIARILRPYFTKSALDTSIEQRFHEGIVKALAGAGELGLAGRVAEEFHARMAGLPGSLRRSPVPDAALSVALRHADEQDYARAADVVTEILSFRPRWRPALRLGALMQARLRNRPKALELAKAAFAVDRRDLGLFHELGRIALSLNDEALLEGTIEVGEEVGLNEGDVLTLRGRLQLRRRQLRLAEGSFQRACECAPRDAWPFVFLGETYLRMGRYEDAQDVLHEADTRHTQQRWRNRAAIAAARMKLALAYLFTGQMDVAEQWIGSDDDDDRSPEGARVVALFRMLREGVSDVPVILERLKLAKAKSRHERSQVHVFAGEILFHADRLEEAEGEFRAAIEADRQNIFAWMKASSCAVEIAARRQAVGDGSSRGYAERAAHAVKQVLAVDPENAAAVRIAHRLEVDFPEISN